MGLDDWEGGGEFTASSSQLNDCMFDEWATIGEGPLKDLAKGIAEDILCVLAPTGRKPREELIKGIDAIVASLVANLLILHRDKAEGKRLAVPLERKKKTRYDRKGFRKLPEVVSALAAKNYIVKHNAQFKRRRTTIEATGPLLQTLKSNVAKFAPIERADGEEVIQLAARPRLLRVYGRKQPNILIDYQDEIDSARLRMELDMVNRFLASHSIVLEGAPRTSFRLVRRFSLRDPDDPIEFEFHGRLYGGFWMTLKAVERHRIRIDGESITDLDFAGMFPRLAYLSVGEEPPQGDLYSVPGLEDHREGAKAGLSALLSYPTQMKSLPTRLKAMLPEGWTASRLRSAYAEHHPQLVPFFEKDFGLDLMFTESKILLTAC
ncbi:conserved hypothetical protein [Roseibium sp. TrichSKD4]|uniref:hypothetical protein n=1 Tax=Roseibium sp. TrichSKD4 TaxID=744980 RepID=UPI0001E56264|nr:hypothetical protein [Roseibium sp. TrichSKD4]EFO32979.1 conserved hypothetical protein [Roseibium sp. TrichSKD4]